MSNAPMRQEANMGYWLITKILFTCKGFKFWSYSKITLLQIKHRCHRYCSWSQRGKTLHPANWVAHSCSVNNNTSGSTTTPPLPPNVTITRKHTGSSGKCHCSLQTSILTCKHVPHPSEFQRVWGTFLLEMTVYKLFSPGLIRLALLNSTQLFSNALWKRIKNQVLEWSH